MIDFTEIQPYHSLHWQAHKKIETYWAGYLNKV